MILLLGLVLVVILSCSIACVRHGVEINIGIITKLANINELIKVSAVVHVDELVTILAINSLLVWLWDLIRNILNIVLGYDVDVSTDSLGSSGSNMYFSTCGSIFALHLGFFFG